MEATMERRDEESGAFFSRHDAVARGTASSAGWSDLQVRDFARRFAEQHRPCWPAYVADVREAMIDSFVLAIVLGQDRAGVDLAEVRSMRDRLGGLLATKYGMRNPTADSIETVT